MVAAAGVRNPSDGEARAEVIAGGLRIGEDEPFGAHYDRSVVHRRESEDHRAPRCQRIVSVGRSGDRHQIVVGGDGVAEHPHLGAFRGHDVRRIDSRR